MFDSAQRDKERDSGISVLPVGCQLRDHREKKGMSGRELAARSSISQSKISKIECGNVVPTADDVRRIGVALRLSGDVIHRLVGSLSVSAEGDLSVFHRWADLEINARRLDGLAVNGVPPLLQTPEYLRHLLRKQFSDVVIVEAMRLRLQRQAERSGPTNGSGS
jgi:transcriptional regulator with XRE-family HTH domain